MTVSLRIAATALFGFASLAASAAPLMPSFANVPTGWATDRFAPASFSNVGTFQGRDDVLGISISTADALTSRPAGFQSTFYNTQGMQHAVSGGAGSSLAADLYIDASWASAANGNVRSDMWGVMSDGTQVTDYTIIGFTNYGGSARYRVWVENDWVNLSTAVVFGDWTSFEILFDGTEYDYFVNGSQVYADTDIDGTTGFSAVIMQAYNFGDASIAGAVPVNYTAHWSNAQVVPEPGSAALAALALLAAAGARRRRSV